MPIRGYSGDSDPTSGDTQIKLEVSKYEPIMAYEASDSSFFPLECVKDYNFEGIDSGMMPALDFGLFIA